MFSKAKSVSVMGHSSDPAGICSNFQLCIFSTCMLNIPFPRCVDIYVSEPTSGRVLIRFSLPNRKLLIVRNPSCNTTLQIQ